MPELGVRDARHNGIPDDFWRGVPCGHPPDPMAARADDGHYVCHCGGGLSTHDALPPEVHDGPPAVVPCDRCGCYLGIPQE